MSSEKPKPGQLKLKHQPHREKCTNENEEEGYIINDIICECTNENKKLDINIVDCDIAVCKRHEEKKIAKIFNNRICICKKIKTNNSNGKADTSSNESLSDISESEISSLDIPDSSDDVTSSIDTSEEIYDEISLSSLDISRSNSR